ncbi:hypothetical protein A2U01_0013449 [Trifolium medium]|uniref:Uncharacterized protein n=1 Tax=Trifolium medium TaxID=97028 RepID=A0A392N017_9FABA|nr:hypothetical protein [Trifolium medium]
MPGREGDLTGVFKGNVTKFGKEGLERVFFDPLVDGMERVMDQITERDPMSFNPDLEFNGLGSKVLQVGPGGVFVVNESLGPNKSNNSHVVVSSNSDTLEISIEDQINSSFPYSHKSKPKNKSLKSQVGTHKCLQLVEAMNEGKICVKKKKGKKGSVMGELTRPVEDLGVQLQSNVVVIGGSGVRENRVERRKEDDSEGEVVPQLRVSSSSGLQFLMGEEESQVPVSPEAVVTKEDLLQNEASKLLGIQKTVGFSFDEEDKEVCDKMVEDELRDRAQKLDRETVIGDQ